MKSSSRIKITPPIPASTKVGRTRPLRFARKPWLGLLVLLLAATGAAEAGRRALDSRSPIVRPPTPPISRRPTTPLIVRQTSTQPFGNTNARAAALKRDNAEVAARGAKAKAHGHRPKPTVPVLVHGRPSRASDSEPQ